MKTVTYGTVSAPFLATRTLLQLSKDEEKNFPFAAPVLRENFYMDDVLCGAASLMEAKALRNQLSGILKKGGMELLKWGSSHPEQASNIIGDYEFENPIETKILGVSWKSQEDCFIFKIAVELKDSYTKRCVLLTIARLFDPLGLLGPVVARAKIFMQSLWSLKIDWIDELPSERAKEWHRFLEDFNSVTSICIGRCIVHPQATKVELHGFVDASEKCYGIVIYCRSQSPDGATTVKLVTSKSRVAPVKSVTMPRLELCATVLLAKLMKRVETALQMKTTPVYLWSNSTIALAWIQKEPNLLKSFVANRVAIIQHLTNAEQWHHVSSEQNPVDLVSRGIDPSSLHNNSLWWNGPTFLATKDFPQRNIFSSVTDNDEFNCEFKSNAKHCVHTKLPRRKKRRGPLDVQEINRAETTLIRIVQLQKFKRDIKSLKENNRVSAESLIKSLNPFLDKDGVLRVLIKSLNPFLDKDGVLRVLIKSLNPFLDKDGVLRVGGRLCNSDLNFECKFPIILPCNHKLTNLIVEYFHLKYFHLGSQALLYQVRQRFWPLRGRNVCRKIVHDCLVCFKVKPITCEQIIGNLPKERVRENFPFDCSGIDFIGPFWIKSNKQRKSSLYKTYVSIFVTKAVHFKLVLDLTTQTFIASLKRFIARRGRPSLIFSDNGKTFIGANAELKRLYKLVINPDPEWAGFLVNENIN
ncbi:integrase catalytic domain-containing protein [Trichonephila clavipes]|nr:integrase catalytic domain-containing protein [Trichonephila clavipes]